MFNVYDIGKTLGIEFGGVIPEDDRIITTNKKGMENHLVFENELS